MKNKLLGWLLITPIVISFLTAILEPSREEDIFLLTGVMMIVFGIWAGVRLINYED